MQAKTDAVQHRYRNIADEFAEHSRKKELFTRRPRLIRARIEPNQQRFFSVVDDP
jgi:hypothetical protein